MRTERLELRPFCAEDARALHALFTDEGVRRWLLDDEVVPLEWVEREIVNSEQRFADGGCGLWVVRERPAEGSDAGGPTSVSGPAEAPASSEASARPPETPPNGVIGFVGFRHFWDPPELELVYGLHPSVWRRGLATEAGNAAMAHAFDDLGFAEVLAATDAPNTPSIAVLERLGFEEWRRTDDGPGGTVFFRVAERRWREVTNRR